MYGINYSFKIICTRLSARSSKLTRWYYKHILLCWTQKVLWVPSALCAGVAVVPVASFVILGATTPAYTILAQA